MKIVVRRDKIPYFSLLLGILLFTMTCLYTTRDSNIFYLILVALFFLTGIEFIQKPDRLRELCSMKYVWWLIFLFLIYGATAYLRTVYVRYSHFYVGTHLLITLMFAFWFFDMKQDDVLECVIQGAMLGSVLSMIFVAINELIEIDKYFTRLGTSTTGNPDVFGMYLGIMSIFTLFAIMFRNHKTYIVVYGLQLAFMLLTGSKQTFIYIIVPFALFQLYKNKKKAWKNILPLVAGLVLFWLIFNIPILYDVLGYRVASMFVSFGFHIEGVETSFSQDRRNDLIMTALKMFPDHPIMGGGWGYFTEFSGYEEYSHCNYTEILVTYGILALLYYYYPFCSMLAKFLRVRKKRTTDVLFLSLLISMLLGDFVRITFYQTALNYCMLFLCIKAFSARRSMAESQET